MTSSSIVGCSRRLAIADQHVETRDAAGKVDIEQPHVGLRILAIGDDTPVLDAADEFLHGGMIEAHHREAVEGQIFDECEESFLDRIESLEMIEMFGIDIGDDRDIGRQFEEGSVAFVGLDHHPVAGAEPRIGPIGIDDAAVDDGRIEAAGLEQGRDERGRRGLAVRPGNRHALLETHQFGEHFRAADDRQALFARRDEFRIVALDRRRHHDDFGFSEMAGIMTDEDPRPLVAQSLDIGALGSIRSLHAIAEIDQHFGNSRHADAADADEMNGAELARQFHEYCSRECCNQCARAEGSTIRITRSASRSAASGTAALRAACARPFKIAMSALSSVKRCASHCGEKSACLTTSAAPTAARWAALAA